MEEKREPFDFAEDKQARALPNSSTGDWQATVKNRKAAEAARELDLTLLPDKYGIKKINRGQDEFAGWRGEWHGRKCLADEG